MATIALPRGKQLVISFPTFSTRRFSLKPGSVLAFSSFGCLVLFFAFVLMYQTAAFDEVSSLSKALLSGTFVVLAPALSLTLSAIALRKYVHDHEKVNGMLMAAISFILTSIYFVTLFAIPFVLLGMYLIYAYIW